MPHLETAALGVWAGVGGRDEKPNEHGISHLLEHMAFKGTTSRSALRVVVSVGPQRQKKFAVWAEYGIKAHAIQPRRRSRGITCPMSSPSTMTRPAVGV